MRRTIILSAVGAIAFTIGLGVSATLASGATEPSTPTNSTSMNGTGMDNMMNGAGMDNMMNGAGMDNMMGSGGMDTMHTEMREALSGIVPADVLAACDAAHTSMSTTTSSPNSVDDGHAAHHPGSQP